MPWSSLQGVVETSRLHFAAAVCQSEKKKKNYISVMYCALFPIFQLSFCLAHLLNFIYLLMWHFCYTEHVCLLYISTMFFFFFKPFHYIIFILFYMIIIIISVAVALAAMFSLSDSLLTIAFS